LDALTLILLYTGSEPKKEGYYRSKMSDKKWSKYNDIWNG